VPGQRNGAADVDLRRRGTLRLARRADRGEQTIWKIYLDLFELDSQQSLPNDDGWAGAEIRACCRLAALLDVPLTQAAQNVVPVARTASESVERLRTWATGRCLDADRGGMVRPAGNKSTGRRRVRRSEPSNN